MKQNIFHSASIKLTSLYLIIIMVISLVFSLGLYNISSQEIERSILRMPGPVTQRIFQTRDRSLIEELLVEQGQAVSRAQNRLKANLFVLNIMIFISGGLLSYYLARRTLEPIEEAHEAQSRFTADASHELRTPITAMRLETEIALADEELNLKKAKLQLGSNIEELDKLTALSEGLLQLSRLDNNDLEKEDVDVANVIQQAVERVEKKSEQKSQTIKVSIAKPASIHVNSLSVVEAIVTLLDNAVKYSPEKSEILISTKILSNSVDISVKDKGIGISRKDLPHVFDRFYRADNSRTKDADNQGYGIGLSIAKSVCKAHGCVASVKSSVNKGSTFTLNFPTS